MFQKTKLRNGNEIEALIRFIKHELMLKDKKKRELQIITSPIYKGGESEGHKWLH